MKEKLTEKDKKMHFAVCLIASIINPFLALGLALGKEYGDSKSKGNHWCWLDLLADGLGMLIGSIIHAVIVYLIVKN